ncbi:peptide ABC transporter substrate-binding protein [Nicoliella spurrieriana]|uniref:Peptide ABC transporter substrate-binding protein n=1 Tax=Nicoliella spurrieriana TaxID=2925830 RepID=A0A976RRT7_9LACO|nr:peptide ABC transporter substrate-binding protein [Nicoliella spurrieriana]UQS86451.1 peptide ABC transporter substrate-binding protein [Nicoliella spurrieriana]
MDKLSNRIKTIAISLTIPLTAVLLTACGQNNSTNNNRTTLNLSYSTPISTMDNSKANDSASLTMLNHTGDGLYRNGKNGESIPALAVKKTVSKDGLTYTFDLRKNVEWSDGTKVTAKDFVYAWRRTANPKTAAQYGYLYSQIHNYKAIQSGKLNPDSLGVKADGDYKLVVKLDKPVPYFTKLLAFPVFFPQEQKVVEKYGSKYGTNSSTITSDGPFILKDWNGTGDTWKLVKNNRYWDKKNVHLKDINIQVSTDPSTTLKLFQQNKLDSTPLNGTQVANYRHNKAFRSYIGGSTVYMLTNEKKLSIFKNADARRALSLAINRKNLVSNVLRDGSITPAGFIPSVLNDFKIKGTNENFKQAAAYPQGVAYDLPKAKELWKQALAQSGKKKLTVNLMTDDDYTTKQVAEFLQAQLQKLPGLKVNLNNIPNKVRMSRQDSGNFDIVLTKWGADFNDPTNFLDLLTSDSTFNFGKWSNSEYDQLMNKANNQDANNPKQRAYDMANAEKILMKDQGVIPVYEPATTELWNPNVKGYVWSPTGMSRNWKGISIK